MQVRIFFFLFLKINKYCLYKVNLGLLFLFIRAENDLSLVKLPGWKDTSGTPSTRIVNIGNK